MFFVVPAADGEECQLDGMSTEALLTHAEKESIGQEDQALQLGVPYAEGYKRGCTFQEKTVIQQHLFAYLDQRFHRRLH